MTSPSSMTLFQAFQLLGLSYGATQTEIKKAYRVMAKKLHPDKAGGDSTAIFQKLQDAYQLVLPHGKEDDEALVQHHREHDVQQPAAAFASRTTATASASSQSNDDYKYFVKRDDYHFHHEQPPPTRSAFDGTSGRYSYSSDNSEYVRQQEQSSKWPNEQEKPGWSWQHPNQTKNGMEFSAHCSYTTSKTSMSPEKFAWNQPQQPSHQQQHQQQNQQQYWNQHNAQYNPNHHQNDQNNNPHPSSSTKPGGDNGGRSDNSSCFTNTFEKKPTARDRRKQERMKETFEKTAQKLCSKAAVEMYQLYQSQDFCKKKKMQQKLGTKHKTVIKAKPAAVKTKKLHEVSKVVQTHQQHWTPYQQQLQPQSWTQHHQPNWTNPQHPNQNQQPPPPTQPMQHQPWTSHTPYMFSTPQQQPPMFGC